MELGQAKKIFFITKKSENVTERTLETYGDVLKKFYDYLSERNVLDVAEVNSIDIREFFIVLQGKGLRGITQHRYFRVLRTFFLFLYQNDFINDNPMKNVKPPKVERKPMRTFTGQEISKLLNAFDKTTFIGCRNYCMFCLLFSTGIRKGELTNLSTADVNVTNDVIRIENGKGQKTRMIPIGKTMKRALTQYLRMRDEFLQGESCKWLFVTPRATRKVSYSCINVLFKNLKKELKLTGEKVSAHTFRHTMAKNYLLNGGDLFSLQAILGHSDIATTKNYLNLNEKEVKNQHMLYNPLDNKDWLY